MKISVIIPVYNSSDTILRTLESVRNQTYKNIEIVIVNDGSKDSSEQIVFEYIKKYPNLDIKLISQVNQGVSKARNVGLEIATGKWIALLDSDDVWIFNKLERQIQILNMYPDIDFLGTNRNGTRMDKFFNIKFKTVTKINAKNLLYKMFFITPTIIFKNEIIEEIGYFDENQRYCEDANYFIKIANKKNCYLLNESLVITGGGKADFGEFGLSMNLWEMEKGELINLRYAFNNRIIGFFEYLFLIHFSLLKYFRRFFLVKKRKILMNKKFKK